MTDKRQTRTKIMRFLREYITEHGYAPTYREIAASAGIVKSNVKHHLDALAAEGVLIFGYASPRSIVLLNKPQNAAQHYLVGDLTAFSPNDPMIIGWDAALAEAKRQQDVHQLDDVAIGIWSVDANGGVSLDGIFHVDTVFTPRSGL